MRSDNYQIRTVARAMLDKKAARVVSLDLRKSGSCICDYFVICDAESATQVQAICDNIEERMLEKCERRVSRQQGRENGFWVILDYSNIVVHVFLTQYRDFYRLEELWADAKKKTYSDGDEQ
ncbi:MAG: ribosome silencing factor [Bacteroidales bacterium]|nr:ribosome silencing factor [Bacteroidales bacterium]